MINFYQKLKWIIEFQMWRVFSATTILWILLSGCAAVQIAQPMLPAMRNAADKVSVIQINGFEMIENMDADEAYLLSKPGASSYIFSYLKTDAGRAFVFISNGNVLPRGLLIGINRTADAMTQFVRDGYRLIPTSTLPVLFSKLPMPTIFIMPVLPNSSMDLNSWINQPIQD
jgi:hypothetical protein